MMTNREKIRSLKKNYLYEIVQKSNSFNDIYAHLGYGDNGSLREEILKRLKELKIDVSHFGTLKENKKEYIEKVRRAVKVSRSILGVLRILNERSTGSAHQKIRRIIKNNNIDSSHLKGRGWNGDNVKKPIRDLLVYGSIVESSHLKKRLLKEGLVENRCGRCGIVEWQGEILSLVLDHINGDRKDNRINNLRLLCPNCNSLTDTFGGRNIGRVPELAEGTVSKTVEA